MSRPASYRKTPIEHPSTSSEYHREYYRRYLSKPALTGVDGRTLRESDWIAQHRKRITKAAKARGITFSPEVTTAYLRSLFESQRGRCFYTGIRFALTRTFRGMRQATVDRVDPSRGYEVGNIVWCLCAINYAKNDYAADDFRALLDDVRRTWPTKTRPKYA